MLFWQKLHSMQLTWNQLVWTDEPHFENTQFNRVFGWSKVRERAVFNDLFEKYQPTNTIMSARDVFGVISSRCQTFTGNSFTFTGYLLECVLPLMNPFPGPRSVLVMDNASIHKTAYVLDTISTAGVKVQSIQSSLKPM